MSQLGDLDTWVRGRDSFKPLITCAEGIAYVILPRAFRMQRVLVAKPYG
jgi:hypothetical protein